MLERDLPYLVAFHSIPGLTYRHLSAIRRIFSDLGRAWEQADVPDFLDAGLPQTATLNILAHRKNIDPLAFYDRLCRDHITVVCLDDHEYPRTLAEIVYPPILLYYKGDIPRDEERIAVVGTRLPTTYGETVTRLMVGAFCREGWTIVSGLARGIDGIAHETALTKGTRTIAVLGSSIDITYPSEHADLAKRIVEHGALVSEFPLGTEPRPYHFPQRNRIISGLSQATVVMEAGEKSGALTTAHLAFEQGRDVFAIPGNLTSPQSRGTNKLIQQEVARPLLHPEDLKLMLPLEPGLPKGWSEKESRIMTTLGKRPKSVEEISYETKLPTEVVLATLTTLELSGIAQRDDASRFTKCS